MAGLVLPEAVAYSRIAGLTPAHGLIAAAVGMSTYAIAGQSRFAIVSATSASAAATAAALASLSGGGDRSALAMVIVAMVGGLFILFGLLRLGFLADFVSRPVLKGFAFGLAISIIIRQLPSILGIPTPAGAVWDQLSAIADAAPEWHWLTIGVGLAALCLIVATKRWPILPGAAIVLLVAILVSAVVNPGQLGIATVGSISLAINLPSLNRVAPPILIRALLAALPISLILFAEAWGSMRTLALSHGDTLSPNRELLALGAANVASALAGGQAAGVGFSASSANESAGATSRLAGAIAAVILILMIAFARPLVAKVPVAVLAAIVIAALLHALDPRPIVRLFRLNRDGVVASLAAVAVLVLGVLNGLLAAVLLSIVALIRRISRPQVVELGRLGESGNFVELSRHPEAVRTAGVVVLRPGEPLFFANAERIFLTVEAQAGLLEVQSVVVSLEDSNDLDSSALDTIADAATRLNARRQRLYLARVKDPLRQLFAAYGGVLAPFAETSFRSVADAVDQAQKEF